MVFLVMLMGVAALVWAASTRTRYVPPVLRCKLTTTGAEMFPEAPFMVQIDDEVMPVAYRDATRMWVGRRHRWLRGWQNADER